MSVDTFRDMLSTVTVCVLAAAMSFPLLVAAIARLVRACVRRRLVSTMGMALFTFALALLPTVAKRDGVPDGPLTARHGIRAVDVLFGTPATPCFTDIAVTPTSVWLSAEWYLGTFLAPPFIEFYMRTNLVDAIELPLGWAEAEVGDTNICVEIGQERMPGGRLPSAAFFAMRAFDGLGDEDDDYDGDGLSNAEERALGTNPRLSDTDGDGVSDGSETARVSYGASLPDFDLSSLSNVLEVTFGYQPVPPSVVVDIPFCVELAGRRSNRAVVHFEGIVAFLAEGVSSLPDYTSFGTPSDLYATEQVAVAAYGCLFWMMGGLNPQLRAGTVWGTQSRWFVVEWRDVMHPLDYADFTLERSTFLLAVSEADPKTVFVRYETLDGRIDGSSGIVGAHGFGGFPDLLVADCVQGSVTTGMTIAYRFNMGTNPLKPDTDGDGLPDGWEMTHGMDPLVANTDDPRMDAAADPDLDGLTNAQEAALGTDPFQPDSDGDGMDDGWESRHGFDPTTHNSQTARADDDADADPDGDGLTNADECAWGTNPGNFDTDNDGVSDGTEIGQNSDPADGTDEGKPNSRTPVQFYFGDHSTSHSEKYHLTVTPVVNHLTSTPRTFSWVNANYGACETRTAMLMPGCSYEVRLAHASTNRLLGPDYDYTLDAVNIPQSVIVSDPDSLLGTHLSSDTFTGAGLAAIVMVYKIEVVVCSPDDADWAELDVSRVVLDDEELCVKVTVTPQVTSLSECRQKFGGSITVKTSGTCPQGAAVSLGDAVFSNVDGKSEIRVSRSFPQLRELGLLPQNDEDGVSEMAWVDVPETSGQDLSDSTAFSSLGHAFRGKAIVASNPNLEASISQRSSSFLKAAGCEIVSATYGNVDSEKRQIMNQADYFYFSGHGSHATGSLQGGLTPSLVSGNWNRDLDVVILAGCAVLDVRNFRFNSLGTLYRWKHWDWKGTYPGEIWEGTGVKYLLGYALKAPLDTDGGSSIVSVFVDNIKNGKDVITSWRDANDTAKGRNACVIDCSKVPHEFWYWDESSGSPVWTKKEKGTVSW